MSKRPINLNNISEEDLLNIRMNELPVKIEGTWLGECIDQLYKELGEKGLLFRPQCYLADEWLTPEKETCIGIPFYLAHPVLIKLEKKFMVDAEGDGKKWCMKLLRHEAGHAICHAYRFHKRKQWRRIFGSPSAEYKDTYKFRPYSKSYVRHLEGYYAQYHPDEDFVETFAVWLTPNCDWETQYRGWKALNKLKYVHQLMEEIKGKEPLVKSQKRLWRLSTLRINLRNHYKKKCQFWAEEFPDFHDPFLRRAFITTQNDSPQMMQVCDAIGHNRRNILNAVSCYSGEKKYIINDVLKNIQKRSRQLQLYAPDNELHIVTQLSSYITALIMNYLYTGRLRGDHNKRKIL